MVSFKSLAVLALGAVPAMAAPASADAANRVAVRQNAAEVFACMHKNFGLTCILFERPLGQCCESSDTTHPLEILLLRE